MTEDSNILNIEVSLDIFGLSTMEILNINMQNPTLGFEFPSPQTTAQPIIKLCKLGTHQKPQSSHLYGPTYSKTVSNQRPVALVMVASDMVKH
jgi:hypothetical protein